MPQTCQQQNIVILTPYLEVTGTMSTMSSMRTTTCSGGCEAVDPAAAAAAARLAITGDGGACPAAKSSFDVAFRWSRASRAGCNAIWAQGTLS